MRDEQEQYMMYNEKRFCFNCWRWLL